jgi:hypothetical protein
MLDFLGRKNSPALYRGAPVQDPSHKPPTPSGYGSLGKRLPLPHAAPETVSISSDDPLPILVEIGKT